MAHTIIFQKERKHLAINKHFLRQETNLIEALSVGATIAIKLIAYVVVNLIAFVAVIAFLDAVVAYLGGRVGHPELNFQVSRLKILLIQGIFMMLFHRLLYGILASQCN